MFSSPAIVRRSLSFAPASYLTSYPSTRNHLASPPSIPSTRNLIRVLRFSEPFRRQAFRGSLPRCRRPTLSRWWCELHLPSSSPRKESSEPSKRTSRDQSFLFFSDRPEPGRHRLHSQVFPSIEDQRSSRDWSRGARLIVRGTAFPY